MRSQGTVGGEVVAFDDTFHVFEIDVFLLQLPLDGVGTEAEFIYLAVDVGVGISRNVFAQRREGDDKDGDDDEQQRDADDDEDEVEQVQFEVEHGFPGIVARHQEVVFAVQLLQRDVAKAGSFELFILRFFCHFAMR